MKRFESEEIGLIIFTVTMIILALLIYGIGVRDSDSKILQACYRNHDAKICNKLAKDLKVFE